MCGDYAYTSSYLYIHKPTYIIDRAQDLTLLGSSSSSQCLSSPLLLSFSNILTSWAGSVSLSGDNDVEVEEASKSIMSYNYIYNKKMVGSVCSSNRPSVQISYGWPRAPIRGSLRNALLR